MTPAVDFGDRGRTTGDDEVMPKSALKNCAAALAAGRIRTRAGCLVYIRAKLKTRGEGVTMAGIEAE